jgi:hypothetical protein
MLHRTGPFNEESLVKSLLGYLPLNGKGEKDCFEVEYMDEELQRIMVANFIWVNHQWIFIDVRDR